MRTNVRGVGSGSSARPSKRKSTLGIVAVPGTTNQLIVVENGFCAAGGARVIKITLDL